MDKDEALRQIDAAIQRTRIVDQEGRLQDIPQAYRQEAMSIGLSTIDRVAGRRGTHWSEANQDLSRENYPDLYRLRVVHGVLKALYHDIERGYLKTATELAHGEVFTDFVEMAQHLQVGGYKDAAAVIIGSTLESHLRQLSSKSGISTTYLRDGKPVPKKSELLNQELCKANVYQLLDQKQVTAWLDLRNDAAHGNYTKYAAEQVALMIQGITNFMTRLPA